MQDSGGICLCTLHAVEGRKGMCTRTGCWCNSHVTRLHKLKNLTTAHGRSLDHSLL